MAKSKDAAPTPTNTPSHGVFVVEGDGDAAFWTRVGAAWAHRDNRGFSLRLAAVPFSRRLVLRTNKAGAQ